MEHAVPVLDAHGVRATFYVLPARVRRRVGDWRAVAAGGHEIGCHTSTHPCSGNFDFSRHNPLEDYTLD
ncbi:MAG: polysaccharide deacetylase family protein, partial [Acidimicrobiales bacterium]